MDRFLFSCMDYEKKEYFSDMLSSRAEGIVDYLPCYKEYNSGVMRFLERLSISIIVNSIIRIPWKSSFLNLESYPYSATDTYHLIITTQCIAKTDLRTFEKFKTSHPNVHMYPVVIDSMHASSPHMNTVREKLFSPVWDAVLTYDKNDAKEYKFLWIGYRYYSVPDSSEMIETASDIYYVGADKGGRQEKVYAIYEFLKKRGVNVRFDVLTKKKSKYVGINYLNKAIPYSHVISKVKETNCILEVLQNKQKAQSVRYFEAVIFNKKLITTNKNIADLPYYNPDYMKIISRISDIDTDWIKKKENIDYGYKGDFSPIGLIEFVKERFCKTETITRGVMNET